MLSGRRIRGKQRGTQPAVAVGCEKSRVVLTGLCE